MKFEFNGQEFDTEKRIFVLGYTIIKNSWFAFDGEESHCVNNIRDYGPVVKSFFVEALFFGVREIDGRKKNVITGIKLNNGIATKGFILGHSPKECLEKFKSLKL